MHVKQPVRLFVALHGATIMQALIDSIIQRGHEDKGLKVRKVDHEYANSA